MGDIELQIFADRLKELRTSLRLTQAQFVEDLGITASALSAYEKNLKNPSISVAKRIAEKYNISIDWLCGLSDKKTNDNEPKTYADMFRIIIELCDIDMDLSNWQAFYEENDIDDISRSGIDGAILKLYDDKTASFFKDWAQMNTLYRAGTIDKHLYDLWISDKLKQYENIPLNSFPFH